MTCTPSKICVLSAFLALLAAGCIPSKPAYLHDVGDLSHYVDQAAQIDYPDVEYPSLDEVTLSQKPLTVIDSEFGNFKDLTLEEAVSYALANSKIIRGYGTPNLQSTRVSPGQDNLSNGPAAAASTYNIAIRQTEPGFIGQAGQFGSPSSIRTNSGLDGNQGVESALADFDAQFTSSLTYNKTDEPRNGTSFLNSRVFQQDQVSWQSEIGKKSANGTQIFFRHVNQYTANNNPLVGGGGVQELDSWYRTSFEAEIRQPLLRGRGTFINRMPIVISRIGTDQELANLEATLQNMVTNIEIRYWDLYCAYRSLDAAKTGRNAALETWRIVKNQYDEGAEVNIQQVAQASEQYYFFGSQVVSAYNEVLDAEGRLRYLLGWSSTDGQFLRPIDEPIMAPVEFDWLTSLGEMLTYRSELRQERWEIKKLQLALAYSKNALLPELDVALLYRWLGLGNKYGTSGVNTGFPDATSGAINELYGGNFQELQLTGSFAMPIGFRRELAMVRNAQLKLAREMARVEDMELDMTKELSEAMRALAANQMIMQSSYNRWKSTAIEESHFKRLRDEGSETLDIALDAQRRRSQSEISFYTALCEYNKVIALIHRRKGTILPYSGIEFAEGVWPDKAYDDAREHARRRGASKQINYGWSRPQVISRGEDMPSGGNRGLTPTVTASPFDAQADDTIIDESMDDVFIMDDGVESYYEFPVLEDGALESRVPTPAIPVNDGVNSRQQLKGVRFVNYQTPIQAAPKNTPRILVADPAFSNSTSARPASKASISMTPPKRDLSAPPVKRLQARATNSQFESLDERKTDPGSSAVLPTGSLDWENLGMARPRALSDRTTAKLKIK